MRRIRPFLLNLPSEIIVNILSRLPVRTILSCKCVCKQFLKLLSTPEFAASHLPLSTPGLLFYQSSTNKILCQVFEFEDGFELQRDYLDISPVMKFDLNVSLGLPNANLWVVGSVNGLLCLHDSGNKTYDALYICNPITREYIALPRIEATTNDIKYPDSHVYGFGVSKITGQYKVVRNVHRHTKTEPCSSVQNYECLVYTVGGRSWRNVQPGPPFGHYDSYSLFLDGNLHKSAHDFCGSYEQSISCFDLESELFEPCFPLPPVPFPPIIVGTLGIMDDRLCFFECRSEDEGTSAIWVMKECGVEKSWTELVDFATEDDFYCTFECSVYPIRSFKNGDILLNYNHSYLYCINSKTKTCQEVDSMIQKEPGLVEAIAHTSSFVSLKSFHGEDVIPFPS